MNNKTYLWVVAIVVLVGVTLTACGGEPLTLTPIPPTPTPAATPTPSASEHVDLGVDDVEQGRLDEAVAHFEEAIRLDADHADAHFNLGAAYYQQGKLDEAIAALQAAVELEPDDAQAYRNLGTIYGDQGQAEKAAAAYEKAIELDPDYGEAHGDLAGIYTKLGGLSEAVAAAEQAIELAPDYAMAYNNLGFAYYSQGMVDEAIAEYREAIRINPDLDKAHDNLGVAYMMQGQLDEAIAEFKEVIRINPTYPGGHVNLGSAYYAQGMHDAAITEYQEAIRINPDLPLAHKNLGLVYRDQGRAEEAVAEFGTYLQLQPDASDRTAVEKEIAKLEGPAMVEYRNAAGSYGLRYPEGWYYEETDTQVEFVESEEALQVAGEETLGILFNIGPLPDFAETVGIPADTSDPAVVWQAMADLIDAEGDEIQTFEIAGYPAAASDISGADDDTPFEGAIAVVLVEDRVLYGLALAPPDQWEASRSTFVSMINNLSFTSSSSPPAESGGGAGGETAKAYDTAFPLPEDVQNFTGEGGESRVNFQTNLAMDEVIAFYRDAFTEMGLSEYELLTTIEDQGFSMVFTGWPSGEELVIQGVVFGESTNVNIRLEEVVAS
jgi:tetratricopeptide (TPR) repeat protein